MSEPAREPARGQAGTGAWPDGGRRPDDRAEPAALRIPVVTVGAPRPWGADDLARVTAQRFETPELSGFWVHLDADVLDPSVMPAVDSPDPDGLLPDELTALLRPLVASPHCVDLDVTIYDPDPDPDGTAGALPTDIGVRAFAEPAPTDRPAAGPPTGTRLGGPDG
ncbi:arginase family protein [Streptomyces sp. NPDC002324]